MYEMAILTTGFEKFEFSRIFSLLLLPDIKCGKIQIEIPKMSKKCGKIKLKFPKGQKVRENSNSRNFVASITISYIL